MIDGEGEIEAAVVDAVSAYQFIGENDDLGGFTRERGNRSAGAFGHPAHGVSYGLEPPG